MEPKYHIAQVNIALAKAEMDSEIMHGFVSRLDEVNKIADNTDGFIWRLQTDDGDSTAIRLFKDPLLLFNMSVWTDVESLKNYVYKSVHVDLIRDRLAWFNKYIDAQQALWWIPVAHTPTTEEAKEKLDYIQKHGATDKVFHFGKPFPMPSK